MLQPSVDWYWFCDNQRLMLSLSKNLQFQTAFLSARLLNLPVDNKGFSVLDSERYNTLAEQLAQSELKISAAETTQILINAVAALAFHRPVALRSWYFAEQAHFGAVRQLASLENQAGRGDVMVLEQDNQVASCMVISKHLQLTSNKHLQQFELIKVMKNRLIPFIAQSTSFSQSA